MAGESGIVSGVAGRYATALFELARETSTVDQVQSDLKFFDAVLSSLRREHKIDERRIYVTGHSNGGRFTYLLWALRGDVFAAVAPSGSAATMLLKDLKPKPCLHIAGAKDPLVKFEWQAATMESVRKLNGCDAEGRPDGKLVTLYRCIAEDDSVTRIDALRAELKELSKLLQQIYDAHPLTELMHRTGQLVERLETQYVEQS